MNDLAKLLARVIAGSLIAGHGAQKLFGVFDGPGLTGWTAAQERMNLHPAALWAVVSASSELGGGLLTALGALNPLGPIMTVTMMLAASYKGHWGKPVWASKGGAELALSFLATAIVIGTSGPGKFSVDSALGIRLPRWITVPFALVSVSLLAESVRPTVMPRILPEETSSGSGEA